MGVRQGEKILAFLVDFLAVSQKKQGKEDQGKPRSGYAKLPRVGSPKCHSRCSLELRFGIHVADSMFRTQIKAKTLRIFLRLFLGDNLQRLR